MMGDVNYILAGLVFLSDPTMIKKFDSQIPLRTGQYAIASGTGGEDYQDEYLHLANETEELMHSEDDKDKLPGMREMVRSNVLKHLEALGIQLKDYPLPVRGGHWEITQGNVTRHTHQGEKNRFCWDFELVDAQRNFHPLYGRDHKEDPDGSYSMGRTIHAVDSGKLVIGFRDPEDEDSSNIIVIKHRETPDSPYDGTKSIYDHIDDAGFLVGVKNYKRLASKYAGKYYVPGIDVKKGEPVAVIGYTGTPYAHLHFSMKFKSLGNLSLPIKFEDYWKIPGDGSYPFQVKSGAPLEREIIASSLEEALYPSVP